MTHLPYHPSSLDEEPVFELVRVRKMGNLEMKLSSGPQGSVLDAPDEDLVMSYPLRDEGKRYNLVYDEQDCLVVLSGVGMALWGGATVIAAYNYPLDSRLDIGIVAGMFISGVVSIGIGIYLRYIEPKRERT